MDGLEELTLVFPNPGVVWLLHQPGVFVDEPRLPENVSSGVFNLGPEKEQFSIVRMGILRHREAKLLRPACKLHLAAWPQRSCLSPHGPQPGVPGLWTRMAIATSLHTDQGCSRKCQSLGPSHAQGSVVTCGHTGVPGTCTSKGGWPAPVRQEGRWP